MKIVRFKVTNYRNIQNSGWINLCDVTAFVGQNEAGKSNLFEALYCLNPFVDEASYDPNEDWPVDDWGNRNDAEGKLVCEAEFILDTNDIEALYDQVQSSAEIDDSDEAIIDEEKEGKTKHNREFPDNLLVRVQRKYGSAASFTLESDEENDFNENLLQEWMKSHVPKFVYIHDYEMSGAQVELNDLKA